MPTEDSSDEPRSLFSRRESSNYAVYTTCSLPSVLFGSPFLAATSLKNENTRGQGRTDQTAAKIVPFKFDAKAGQTLLLLFSVFAAF